MFKIIKDLERNSERSISKKSGPNFNLGLGDRDIVTPYYFEKQSFIHIKIEGIDKLLYQEWDNISEVSKREVYLSAVKEFFD